MMDLGLKSVLTLLFCCLCYVSYGQLTIWQNETDGIFEVGDTAVWKINIPVDSSYENLRYRILPGALQTSEEGMVPGDGSNTYTYVFQEPGSVIFEVRWGSTDSWRNRVVSGGICAPEKLEMSAEKPTDFEAFWSEKIEELQSIPMNTVTSDETEEEGVVYAKIQMDNIRNSKIMGQMAMPADGDKFPALLIVQWAGVYGLNKDWVLDKAAKGWLTLNINPHDLPIDEDPDFYRAQSQDDLKNYPAIGNENRYSSYFLRMYLSCYRGVEYLKAHPNWNGDIIAVMGTSQGGMQTLMVAGLHPEIDAAMALVPAGFDMHGPDLGRRGGWPQWYYATDGKDSLKVREASRYYDVANFTSNITCPVLVGVGLLDETCPPEGIIAGMNQLTQNKQIVYLAKSQHQDRGTGSQAPYRKIVDEVWLPKLKMGQPVLE